MRIGILSMVLSGVLSRRKTEYEGRGKEAGRGSCRAAITKEEADKLTYEHIIRRDDGWNPRALIEKYLRPPYSLSPEKRAELLLKELTLEEKVSLMMDGSKAVERLGIKPYNWWNEALHGVARAGLATVFPQPIGMAAFTIE